MLDQNTDRMWYVIGAVLIGAAIIFGMNTLMPEAFASVGESFEDTINVVSGRIDTLVSRENLLKHGDLEIEGGTYINADGSIRYGSGREFLRHEDLAPIIETYGLDQTYTLAFEIKSLDTSQMDQMRVYMQNGNSTKYGLRLNGKSSYFTVSEDFREIRYENVSFYKSLGDHQHDTYAHLAFFGGYTNDDYGNGNVPVVRNVRLFLE